MKKYIPLFTIVLIAMCLNIKTYSMDMEQISNKPNSKNLYLGIALGYPILSTLEIGYYFIPDILAVRLRGSYSYSNKDIIEVTFKDNEIIYSDDDYDEHYSGGIGATYFFFPDKKHGGIYFSLDYVVTSTYAYHDYYLDYITEIEPGKTYPGKTDEYLHAIHIGLGLTRFWTESFGNSFELQIPIKIYNTDGRISDDPKPLFYLKLLLRI